MVVGIQYSILKKWVTPKGLNKNYTLTQIVQQLNVFLDSEKIDDKLKNYLNCFIALGHTMALM